ncbi:short chain dehydrogenase [Seminavis robusta]|uniref:Short chain dehydrogenase n=1 Tax=Seminavis robusta TaxID=568900 RepID=A0A9N8E5V5_9STRA|nr:short chain dehydrogenase [Seminavis robusta]|eukprot:Sro703_g190150.1 short chain dehydrogenase (442) ;mRNA; f:38997-40488
MLKDLNLSCAKILHLGRNLGAKYLEMGMTDAELIRQMGQWANGVFDNSYSTKLPMEAIRALAGFIGGRDAPYFLTRSTVEPDKDLLLKTPLKWVYLAYDALCEARRCAMMIKSPERAEAHPMFTEMEVFQTEEFQAFKEQMRLSLAQEKDPLDNNLQRVLPGVHQRFEQTNGAVAQLTGKVDTMTAALTAGIDKLVAIHQETAARQQQVDVRAERLACLLEKGAQALRGNQEEEFTDLLRGAAAAGEGFEQPDSMEIEDILQAADEEAAATTLLEVGARTTTTTTIPTLTTGRFGQFTDDGGLTTQEIELGGTPHITTPSSRFRLKPKHTDLTDLWDEWHGLGTFYCAIGGVAGRETSIKGWRSHWTRSQQTHLSRNSACIKGITAWQEQHRMKDAYEACADLQTVFANECKCTVEKMKLWFQAKGIIPKGAPRGKQRKKN